MWKRSMVIISGAALAASLPMAALAVTPDAAQTPDADADWAPVATELELRLQFQDPTLAEDPLMIQEQVMTQERVREHILTGPIDGVVPIQKQERLHEQLGVGNSDARMGNEDAPKGNPDAPMSGDGTGECLSDGEPVGTGPHGPGAGNNG
jgi:hypothetical protein